MPPAWEIEKSFKHDGYIVRIHGKTVLDADGSPTVYRPPYEITSNDEFDAWQEQLRRSIEKMSGVAVKW